MIGAFLSFVYGEVLFHILYLTVIPALFRLRPIILTLYCLKAHGLYKSMPLKVPALQIIHKFKVKLMLSFKLIT